METNQPTSADNNIDSIADYHNDVRIIELEGYALRVKKARNALFLTAALVFLGEMIGMYIAGGEFNIYVLIIALFEAGIFVALALWTKKKPYSAVTGGLIAFIGIMLIAAVAGAYESGAAGFLKAVFGGIIVKVIILVTLIRALADSKALQEAREENNLI